MKKLLLQEASFSKDELLTNKEKKALTGAGGCDLICYCGRDSSSDDASMFCYDSCMDHENPSC